MVADLKWVMMWWMRWAREMTGSVLVPVPSWWTSWPRVLFFWLEILRVAEVAVSNVLSGAVLGMGVVPAHKVTPCSEYGVVASWKCRYTR